MNGKTLRMAIVWLSVGLSFITLMVILGRNSNLAFPSMTSSKPSGTRLFGEILEQNGVKVRQDRNQIPQLKPDDVAVAFLLAPSDSSSPYEHFKVDHLIRNRLIEHANSGGRVIFVEVPADFNRGSQNAQPASKVKNAFNARLGQFSLQAAANSGRPRAVFGEAYGDELLPVWGFESRDHHNVYVAPIGEGVGMYVTNGFATTNRFIDQADHAKFFAQLFKSFAGKGGSVVFTEASFGNISDDGLISALGGWARATLWQGFLLFGVIAWSFAVAFGQPIRDQRNFAGTRDMMEAFSYLLRRSKKPSMAKLQVVRSIETDLRRKFGLSASASANEIEPRLPEELQLAYRNVAFGNEADPSQNLTDLQKLREYSRQARKIGGTL